MHFVRPRFDLRTPEAGYAHQNKALWYQKVWAIFLDGLSMISLDCIDATELYLFLLMLQT